jgi:hypothetical protein
MKVLKCSWRQPLYTSNIWSVICCLLCTVWYSVMNNLAAFFMLLLW